MSDGSDGSGPVPRRPANARGGGAPVSGALAIGLAVVAVIAGFLILNSISDDGKTSLGITPSSGPGAIGSAPSTAPSSVSTLPEVVTQPTFEIDGAQVIVSNANGQGGSAGGVDAALKGLGFQTVEPTNSEDKIDVTVIHFNPAIPLADQVANSVNVAFGGTLAVTPMPDPVPVQGGDLKGAAVLVMLGTDKVGATLVAPNVPVANPALTGNSVVPAG